MPPDPAPLDLADLSRWRGRTEEARDVLTARLADAFEATLSPHLAPVARPDAPLAIHWCLAPPVTPMTAIGPDGHAARGGFLPPVPLPRRMWAGGEIETLAPLRVGDEVSRRSTVGDISVKEGRSGRLCFVAVHHELSTARGLAVRERHDIVYRDVTPLSPAAAPDDRGPGLPTPDLAWDVEVSSVLLFRYSALTFNSHRIHYDLAYVRDVEGYSDLVVHGPLQGTCLFNIVAALAGEAPRRFRYRGVAPLTVEQGLRVCAAQAGGGLHAWAQDRTGRITMRAEATLATTPGQPGGTDHEGGDTR